MSQRSATAPPLINFDHHSEEYRDYWPEIATETATGCPVARSDAHGGFWLVSGHAAVTSVVRDYATYSSAHDLTGEHDGYEGIRIPPAVYHSIPGELDPPEFFAYRNLLAPAFSAEACRRLEPFLHDITHACLDRHLATGRIDLVRHLANPVPTMVIMKILGLPLTRWREVAEPAHEASYRTPDGPGYEPTLRKVQRMNALLRTTIAAKRERPAADLISRLVTAELNLTDQAVLDTVGQVIGGGVDPTTSLTASALHWLSDHPRERRRLIEEPDLIPSATEEFLRYFSPVQALARTATRDVVLDGQQLRAGDRVLTSFAAANRDPAVFEAASELRLDRSPNRHLAFGSGIHHCTGALLARLQFRVMLAAVLRRLPDYAVDAASAERYPSIAAVNGYVSMPTTFTPPAARAE
jgi:cytochrome P450